MAHVIWATYTNLLFKKNKDQHLLPVRKGRTLYDSIHRRCIKVVKSIETETRRVVLRGSGGRNGELFNGYSFNFVRRKEFWRLVAQQCEYT